MDSILDILVIFSNVNRDHSRSHCQKQAGCLGRVTSRGNGKSFLEVALATKQRFKERVLPEGLQYRTTEDDGSLKWDITYGQRHLPQQKKQDLGKAGCKTQRRGTLVIPGLSGVFVALQCGVHDTLHPPEWLCTSNYQHYQCWQEVRRR